jgi:hypothetical protein
MTKAPVPTRPDHVLLALAALVIICVTVLIALHDDVPGYLWAIGFGALTGGGVASPVSPRLPVNRGSG